MLCCLFSSAEVTYDFMEAVLADVAFDICSVTENGSIAATELDMAELLGFKIIRVIFVPALVAPHREDFFDFLDGFLVGYHYLSCNITLNKKFCCFSVGCINF